MNMQYSKEGYDSYDCIVVGAGLSGLSAAYKLALKNRSVLVLEAADRVGGRTNTIKLDNGSYADLGGMWVGPQHKKVKQLAEEFGLELMDQYDTGKTIMLLSENKKTEYSGTIPKLSILALLDLQFNGLNVLEKTAKSILVSEPANHLKSAIYDSMSLETWKQNNLWTDSAKDSLDVACRMVFGCEPCEISFLYFLFYVKSNGGLMMLLDIEGGAQEKRIVNGSQQLSERLMERIRSKASKVLLNKPVDHIDYTERKAIIRVMDGQQYECDTVILACPPALLKRHIHFTPELPSEKMAVINRGFAGSYTKCLVFYETMFWRENGYSGSAVCSYNDNDFPVAGVFDYTDKDKKFPALAVFVVADPGIFFASLNVKEQEERIIASVVNIFGEAARSPTRIVIKEWAKDPWTRGCPVNILPPGTCKKYGTALHKPVQQLFWAGTEAALSGCGYMEGTLDAGEQAAENVEAFLTVRMTSI